MTRDELVDKIYAIADRAGTGPVNGAIDAMFKLIPGLSEVIEGRAVIAPLLATADMFAAGQAVVTRQGGKVANGSVNCESVLFAMLVASPYRRGE